MSMRGHGTLEGAAEVEHVCVSAGFCAGRDGHLTKGCMLQWRPGSDREIVWNDREGDRYVCRVLDVKTRKVRTLPRAIGTISPDGKVALCEDFSRIWNFRAGYGYAGIPAPNAKQSAPADIGVFRMDLDTGEARLLVSVADLFKIPYPRGQKRERELWLYHIPGKKKVPLGRYHEPPAYRGEWRCDLHPRLSRSGRKAVIDTPYKGDGRQMYLIDIGKIVDTAE